jgi:hypothetical protein
MEIVNLRDKRTWVKGVFADCPMGEPLSDCPANGLRSLPLAQLVRIVNDMSESKLDAVMAYHAECVRQREANTEQASCPADPYQLA